MTESAVAALLCAAESELGEPARRRLARALREAEPDSAPARYRRLVGALDGLAGPGAAAFRACDAVVLARMGAAAAVMRSVGFGAVDLPPSADAADPADPAGGHLRRAVRWQRHAHGPGPELLRACAGDIARGSLRLWASAGGVPGRLPAVVASRRHAQLARVCLVAQARARCAGLRARLGRQAAELPLGGFPAFAARVWAEAAGAAADVDGAISAQIAALGLSADPAAPMGQLELVDQWAPAHRGRRLENRLTTVVGVGFGVGVAVTADRLASVLRPDWAPAATIGCGLGGLALVCWVVVARRLLTERAAAERWLAEVVANLRAALEERVLTRMLAAAPAGRPGAPGQAAGWLPGLSQLTVGAQPELTFKPGGRLAEPGVGRAAPG